MTKRCTICGEIKEPSEFYNRKGTYDGKRRDCKVCFNARAKEYVAGNREKVAAAKSAYYDANRESRNAYRNAWRSANKDKPSVVALKLRNERVKLSTPEWADKRKMAEIYADAAEFRKAGLEVHVDHIIPLVGKIEGKHVVSGLHVHNNLTVKLAYWNDSKGANFG